MTSQLIDPSRELAREVARLDDGRFGTKVLGEVDLDLPIHDSSHDTPDDHWDDEHELEHEPGEREGFSLDRTVAWWRDRLPKPRTAAHDDLTHSLAEARQEQVLDDIEGAPEQDPVQKKWHQRFLDTMLRYTAPQSHFTLKQSLKTAFTKGGVLMAGIATFALSSHYVGAYMRNESPDPPPPVDPNALRLTELSNRYDCYRSGLGEGEIPAHAIIKVIKADGTTVKVVPFDEGWAAHVDKNDNRVLESVCRL